MSTSDERAIRALDQLSAWIDRSNEEQGRTGELLTLHRVIKIGEEAGEVVNALIGALGANPRKGVTNTMEKVLNELLDVAVTALGAYEHIDGHQGRALWELNDKIAAVARRAGAVQEPLWEYGFYDSESGPNFISWYCFGLPFETPEQAEHTGSKSTYGLPVIVRRRQGETDWEPVEPEGANHG